MDVAVLADTHRRRITVNAPLPGRPSNFVNQRRSQRVLLAVPLEVSGKRANKTTFTEATATIIINSHGALLHLKEPVASGQILTLNNPATNEQLDCKVVEIFAGQEGIPEVAVEFSSPCARFWRVTFPPVDWSPRSPEAKKYVGVVRSSAKVPLLKK
jgi:hypothetical protein